MGRLLPRYLAVACCVAFLLLILLGLIRSYARPAMHVQVSKKNFWAIVSTSGHLHWVSYHLHHDDTSFAGIGLKENALTCELRVQPHLLLRERQRRHGAARARRDGAGRRRVALGEVGLETVTIHESHHAARSNVTGSAVSPRRPRFSRHTSGPGSGRRLGSRRSIVAKAIWPSIGRYLAHCRTDSGDGYSLLVPVVSCHRRHLGEHNFTPRRAASFAARQNRQMHSMRPRIGGSAGSLS